MLDNDLLNKLRLRRLRYPSLEKLVQKNLLPLREHHFRRKLAQTRYYDKFGCRSPLLRDINKLPIHARLGLIPRCRKKVAVLGTCTNTLIPRKNRRSRVKRTQKQLAVPCHSGSIRQKKKELEDENMYNSDEILSYQIKVFNDDASDHKCFGRFKLQLNSLIQDEIRQIQNSNPRQIFHALSPIMPVSTYIPLNYRFSNLT